MEIWKDIKKFEGIYQVSNLGNIKSLNNNKTKKEKILKLNKDKKGYLYVDLYKNNKSKRFVVHRLVAEAFIPNPENKPCIDHINTIRDDNRVENLRWVTYKENCNNPLTRKHNSEVRSGKNHHMYGKHHTDETKNKMSKSIKEHFEKYPQEKKDNGNSLKLICIFADGTSTEPMTQKELMKYLGVGSKIIVKLRKSGKPYKVSDNTVKNRERLLTLEGIRIIEVSSSRCALQ